MKRPRFGLTIDCTRPHHGGISGKTGCGKSVLLERIQELYYKRGWKIVDLYSGDRMEGAYKSLPSTYPFWKRKLKTRNGDIIEPRGFPVSALVPVSSLLPKRLPDIFKPFTIPISTITYNDLIVLMGRDISTNIENLFQLATYDLNYDSTLADFLNNIQSLPSKPFVKDKSGLKLRTPTAHQLSDIVLQFHKFIGEKLFSSGRNVLALDLKKELNDRNKITDLITNFLPSDNPKYKLFVISYFLRQIYDLARNNKIPKTAIFIRELPDILPKNTTDKSEMVVKEQIEFILKQGRGHNLCFWMDYQRPSDVLTTTLDSKDDFMEILTPRTRRFLTHQDKYSLTNLRKRQFLCITPYGIKSNQESVPPLARHREPSEDFFEVWRKEGKGFIDWSKELKQTDKEFKESVKEYNLQVTKEYETIQTNKKTSSFYDSIPLELIKLKKFKREDVERILNVRETQSKVYLRAWSKEGVVSKYNEGKEVYYEIKL